MKKFSDLVGPPQVPVVRIHHQTRREGSVLVVHTPDGQSTAIAHTENPMTGEYNRLRRLALDTAAKMGGVLLEDDRCQDCGMPYDDAMYVDEVWHQANARYGGHGLICLACMEQRLGRKLTIDDFTDAPANYPIRFGFRMGRDNQDPAATMFGKEADILAALNVVLRLGHLADHLGLSEEERQSPMEILAALTARLFPEEGA